ncbi:MAG TPA: hypothetical protein VHV81_14715 [Steroidobacteraceae bacterium]|jgi:hypothetical protein|nr:hypothetical protein [Steroidobacteraceae bacterium]
MNTADLEQSYTALAESIGRTGGSKTPLLLATLALDLLRELPDAEAALARIRRAEELTSETDR